MKWFNLFKGDSGDVYIIHFVICYHFSGRFTFNVSKFLMINLAIADLMMGKLGVDASSSWSKSHYLLPLTGVYLLIIAIVDLRTVGVYFNFAIDWQHGKFNQFKRIEICLRSANSFSFFIKLLCVNIVIINYIMRKKD